MVSTGSRIDYCFMSESLREFPGLQWLRKGELLPREVETYRFNQASENVQSGQRAAVDADLRDWFGGRTRAAGHGGVGGPRRLREDAHGADD